MTREGDARVCRLSAFDRIDDPRRIEVLSGHNRSCALSGSPRLTARELYLIFRGHRPAPKGPWVAFRTVGSR